MDAVSGGWRSVVELVVAGVGVAFGTEGREMGVVVYVEDGDGVV